jgi:hypothetical protein
MRTTVTLDDDVAARLRALRKRRPFKELVNAALRAGLDRLEEGEGKPEPYSISPVEGCPRRIDLDNVAELVAETEGDHYR